MRFYLEDAETRTNPANSKARTCASHTHCEDKRNQSSTVHAVAWSVR